MTGVTLPGQVQLYVRSMGKALKVVAIAHDTAAANRYCATHDSAAVVAELGHSGLCLIANKYDIGEPTCASEFTAEPGSPRYKCRLPVHHVGEHVDTRHPMHPSWRG